MWVAFANLFSKNISIYAIFNDQSFNDALTNYIISFEQLSPDKRMSMPLFRREAKNIFWDNYLPSFLESVSFLLKVEYCIWPNYCTYPYKRTVKKFCSLQITANVLFLYFFIKAYVVGTHLNCIDLSMQFK